mgnify:CR=1 FL=1|tara:strand:+ start:293 stop:1075 length:783 start_codon:yes stop_codon:yes gene_type:complete
MAIYNGDISKVYEKIDAKKQKELLALARSGDSIARERVINSCLPMVISLAKKFSYNNKHIDFEDYLQEGNIALIKAIDAFDVDRYKTNNISTLVHVSVYNAMISTTHKSKYKISSAFSQNGYSSKLKREIVRVMGLGYRKPEEIAEKLNRKVKTITNMLSRMGERVGMTSDNVNNQVLLDEKEPDHLCLGYLIEILDNEDVIHPLHSILFKKYHGLCGNKKHTAAELANEYGYKYYTMVSIINKIKKNVQDFAVEDDADA